MAVLGRGLVNYDGWRVRRAVYAVIRRAFTGVFGVAVDPMITGKDVRNTIDGIFVLVVFCYITIAAVSFVAGVACSWVWGLLR